MRTTAAVVVALALAAAGCKSWGFAEEAATDWSAKTSKGNTYLDLDAPQKVVLTKFNAVLTGAAPTVTLALKNEGDGMSVFSLDVEFGYPAPAGSFAPYDPQFVSVDILDFAKDAVSEQVVSPPQGTTGLPLFARVVTTKGREIRMTTSREQSPNALRQGTLLLSGRVEVVAMAADLTQVKPTLSFTIENVDAKDPTRPIGDLKYIVQFSKEGKFVELGRLRPRGVGKPLGAKGDRVTFEIAGIENADGALAGSKPVLRLTQ